MRLQKGWNLEGGGPWRILDECPAERHVTLFAYRGGCRCPRAISLYLHSLELMKQYSLHRREEDRKMAVVQAVERKKVANVPKWFKAGPWKISPLCRARGHNTLSWARGSVANCQFKCTCPRALALLEEFRRDRSKSARIARARNRNTYRSTPVQVVEPDWSKGACRQYPAIADMGFNDEVSKKGIAERATAKALCQECPMATFGACKTWIVAKEGDTPGVMGGVYAGMDRWNRQGYDMRQVGKIIKRVPLSQLTSELVDM